MYTGNRSISSFLGCWELLCETASVWWQI